MSDSEDRLSLIRAELRRVERSVRMLRTLVAQEIDSKAADTNHSPKEDTDDHADQDH